MVRPNRQLEFAVSGQDLCNVCESPSDNAQLVLEGVMDVLLLKSDVRAVNTIQGPGPVIRSMITKCMNQVKDLIRDKARLWQFREVGQPLCSVIKPLQVQLWARMRLI